MQAAVAGEQPERTPALVDVRRGGILKAANIVTPETKAGQTNGQPATQTFGHRFIVGVAVAAPVHRKLLRADRGRTGEQHGLFFTDGLFQHVPYQFVVDVRIMVVHFLRIGTVKPLNVSRNAFAKVSFEAINADIHQTFQLVGIPLAGFRIGKVINRQARLPFIPLPQGAVRALEQITFIFQFIEQRGFLADIGVYPYADLQPFLFQAADHTFRVREGHRIPLKVAPLEGFHPEAVEMEDVQRQIALGHPVDKTVHRRFIVISGERCSQPQTE